MLLGGPGGGAPVPGGPVSTMPPPAPGNNQPFGGAPAGGPGMPRFPFRNG